jgi:hypothetical protein
MSVGTDQTRKNDPAFCRDYVIPLPTAINLTDAVLADIVPGFAGEIVGIQAYNRVKAGTVTLKCSTGGANFGAGRSAMTNLSPTTAVREACTLSTTLANRRFTSTEAIRVAITTDGSGALTNGLLVITVRPRPQQGEYL